MNKQQIDEIRTRYNKATSRYLTEAEYREVYREWEGDIEMLLDYIETLEAEIATDDKLLADHKALLDKIPECPDHGSSCLPHAREWVEKVQAENARLRDCLGAANRRYEWMAARYHTFRALSGIEVIKDGDSQ